MGTYIESKTGVRIPVESVEGGRFIVRHDTLVEAAASRGLSASFERVYMSNDHQVVSCQIRDAANVKIAERVGESTPASRITPIADAYRATMAFTRAFDRAVLCAMQFNQKKVFLDPRIPKDEAVGEEVFLESGVPELGQIRVIKNPEIGYVISHLYLENFVAFNSSRLRYDFQLFAACPERTVVACSLCDLVSGRKITKVGEASAESLVSDVAKTYPVTTAYNRAFDRAVIAMMGLPGKVFSTEEQCIRGGTRKCA